MSLPTTSTRRLLSSLNLGLCSPLTTSPQSLFHTSLVRSQGGKPKATNDPVVKFFSRFPEFNYDTNAAWPGEWRRLREELEKQLQLAAIERFRSTYGSDPSDLFAWQKMCKVVGIDPPPTLDGCRAAIKQLYINTVDLEHGGHLGNVNNMPRFSSEAALKEYSQKTGSFYWTELVPRRSLLKSLQRHLPDSRPEPVHMDNRKKKGGKQAGMVSSPSKRNG